MTQHERLEIAKTRLMYGDEVGCWFMLFIWAANKPLLADLTDAEQIAIICEED
jgi:hypothetical protein